MMISKLYFELAGGCVGIFMIKFHNFKVKNFIKSPNYHHIFLRIELTVLEAIEVEFQNSP